mmetsp:Transcript_17709/g.42182  ORF Transcript_17709/g.42182 Transcript_17709/m.42182 type:complete len:157 (+) Transcript_17709:277-747(+)
MCAQNAKVCDFGTTTQECSVHTAALMGTLLWCAPELFDRTGKYDSKADVYSFGIVMWEGWSCHDPYEFNTDAPRGWPMLGSFNRVVGPRYLLTSNLTLGAYYSTSMSLCANTPPAKHHALYAPRLSHVATPRDQLALQWSSGSNSLKKNEQRSVLQ